MLGTGGMGAVYRAVNPDTKARVAVKVMNPAVASADSARARFRTRDSDLTRTGSLMGTASYMATEQIAAGLGEIGPWSDVYGMGAILYEMLAGTPAYGGTTVTEVLQNVLKAEAIPLVSVRP